ncbi:hypothetical protein Tco_1010088, partial [Tanacetum coccineum]
DDSPLEGEKRVKRQKASKSSKSARGSSSKKSANDSTTYVTKKQNETPELITEFQNVDKRVPTIFDRARMKATLNDMLIGNRELSNQGHYDPPTLTFPGIEEYEPYSIVNKPTMGLIYLNNKDEKRVMYLVEIVKFYDATLENVLKEVKLKIFQSEP